MSLSMATITKPIRVRHMTGAFRKGFTLIELLTVIAIIGILAGILIPVIGSAQTSALRAKARAQFNGYAMALTEYRNVYGYYPLGLSGEPTRLGNEGQFNSQNFRLALTGRNENGQVDNTYNRRAQPFYSFSSSEFNEENQIVDPFGNPNIYFIVDDNNSGSIEVPSEVGGGTVNIKVGVYTLKDADLGYEEIKNW